MMRRLKNETGYSIIVAIVIFTVLSMMGTAMIDMTSFDARIKSQEVQALQSTEIGNAGIQYALEKITVGFSMISQTPFENLNQRLKRIRREKRITMRELAMRMRVSPGYISKLERGEARPTEMQADVIRAFLGGKL